MIPHERVVPPWFPYLDLACASSAAAFWYLGRLAVGAWPLAWALAPWLFRLALTGRLTCHTPFDFPLLLFLLTAGLGVWAAYDRQAAWHKFWLIVGSLLLFYALVNAESIGDKRAWLLGITAAGMTIFFLVTHDWDTFPAKISVLTQVGQALQRPIPRFLDHSPNLNIVGSILVMLLPFTGLTVIRSWQRVGLAQKDQRVLRWLLLAASLGLAATAVFGLVLTTSRGAWIALGSALALVIAWCASRWLRRRAERRKWIFPLLLGLGLSLVVTGGVLWSSRILAVTGPLFGTDTLLSRAELLRTTPILVRDYPFIGAGLDSFEMLYSTYALLIHVGFIPHSHNFFLNLAIEQGVPGLLALMWMWILFAVGVWRGLLRPARQPDSRSLGAAALSLIAILIHGLLDNALYSSHGVLLLFVPLAFAVPALKRHAAGVSRRLPLGLPLAAGLLLVAALVWRDPLLSLVHSNLGAIRQSQTELSIYSWPEWPIQDEVRRTADMSQPIAEFEQALLLDARNATANRRLGMIELSLGEYEDALRHLGEAYTVEPWSVTTRQLYGEALIVNGRLDQGRALWADVNNEQGQLAARLFWYQHIGDAERAAWVQQAMDNQ